MKQVLEQEPVSPSRIQYHIPRDLETICMKCLQKEPRKRYATAKDMADDLIRYLQGEPIKARRTPPVERAVKWVKRRPAKATALAFVSMAVVSVLGYGGWYWNHQRALERLAERHLALVRDETADDLDRAREAIARKEWSSAGVILTKRNTLLLGERDPSLASSKERTGQLLAEVERSLKSEQALAAEQKVKDEVQNRYQRFVNLRREALFRDAPFAAPSARRPFPRHAIDFPGRGIHRRGALDERRAHPRGRRRRLERLRPAQEPG